MTLRRRVGGLAVLALLLALAGCASIPESGAVQTAGPSAAADDPNLVFSPVEPSNGEDPEDIVKGFVLAAVAGGDFTVARKYLTKQASEEWNPAEQILIHQQAWSVTTTGTGRVSLSVPVAAQVDATGQYIEKSGRVPLPFELTRVGGQWRISDPPDGIVLAQNVFSGFAKPLALQFFAPGFRRLVPDVRWFPSGTDRSTAIVQALLAGPSAALQSPVTASAFPVGTLLSEPVTESGGLTVVQLRVPGGAPDERTAERMQQQLAASLPEKTTSSIRLVVDGEVQSTAPALAAQPSGAPDPAVLAGGRFGTLSGGRLVDDGALGRAIAGVKPTATAITVGVRSETAAVLNARGVTAITGSAQKLVDPRRDLVAPTLDQNGWIYSVPQDDPSGLRAFTADGRSHVDLDGPLGQGDATGVTAIEASPDGTRMLVLTETASGPEAWVAGIERSASGAPLRLTAARFQIDVDSEQVLGGTWASSTAVAVLTGTADTQSVLLQTLGGPSTRLGGLTGAVSVSGPVGNEVLALLDSGAIYQHPASLWEARPSGSVPVEVLAVQR